jgi:hypothetical protein
LGLAGPAVHRLVERRRPPEFVPTIIVSDRPSPPSAGLASTMITIGRPAPDAPTPDLHFEQTSSSTVRIATATFTTAVVIARSVRNRRGLGEWIDGSASEGTDGGYPLTHICCSDSTEISTRITCQPTEARQIH